MAIRCEYCGQLFDGLSCPHCGAPRGEEKKPSGITINESGITINGACNQVVIGSGNSVVSVSQTINGNVSVHGNGNTIFADSKVYWTDVYPVNTEITDIDTEVTGDGNVQVIGDNNVVSTHEHRTDDWAKWSEQTDPEWNPEEDPENVDYFLVDIDPYKDEQASKVGVPKPVEVEGGPLDDIVGNLAAIAIFGLACAALMLFWWLFSKL